MEAIATFVEKHLLADSLDLQIEQAKQELKLLTRERELVFNNPGFSELKNQLRQEIPEGKSRLTEVDGKQFVVSHLENGCLYVSEIEQ